MGKETKTITGLSFIALIGLIPLLFSSNEMNREKIDIYLFYDRLRYPENIAYDVSEFATVTFFIYLIWRLVPLKIHKKYVECFLISSIINALGYFLFYSQYISLIQIPILIILITTTYYKHDHEKRNNAR